MRSLNECDAGRAADRGRGLKRAVWLKKFGGPEVLVAGDAGCGGRWPIVETLRGLRTRGERS
jgi:hypothetical protein